MLQTLPQTYHYSTCTKPCSASSAANTDSSSTTALDTWWSSRCICSHSPHCTSGNCSSPSLRTRFMMEVYDPACCTQKQCSASKQFWSPAAASFMQHSLQACGLPKIAAITIKVMPQRCMSSLQALAIIGAFVGGWLARQRRLELESTNRKLRHINTELRRRQHEVGTLLTAVSTDPSCETIAAIVYCIHHCAFNSNCQVAAHWPGIKQACTSNQDKQANCSMNRMHSLKRVVSFIAKV